MNAPVFNLSPTGDSPKVATQEALTAQIQEGFDQLHQGRVEGDAALMSGLSFQGPWDASTAAFPSVNGSGGAVSRGDVFWVSVAGTFGSVTYAVNEPIVARVDGPSTSDAADWYHAPLNPALVPVTDRIEVLEENAADVFTIGTFATRAAFVAAVAAAASFQPGATYTVAGIQYEYVSAPYIDGPADLPGFKPVGDLTPEHFGAVSDNATNSRAAIQAAEDYRAANNIYQLNFNSPIGTYYATDGPLHFHSFRKWKGRGHIKNTSTSTDVWDRVVVSAGTYGSHSGSNGDFYAGKETGYQIDATLEGVSRLLLSTVGEASNFAVGRLIYVQSSERVGDYARTGFLTRITRISGGYLHIADACPRDIGAASTVHQLATSAADQGNTSTPFSGVHAYAVQYIEDEDMIYSSSEFDADGDAFTGAFGDDYTAKIVHPGGCYDYTLKNVKISGKRCLTGNPMSHVRMDARCEVRFLRAAMECAYGTNWCDFDGTFVRLFNDSTAGSNNYPVRTASEDGGSNNVFRGEVIETGYVNANNTQPSIGFFGYRDKGIGARYYGDKGTGTAGFGVLGDDIEIIDCLAVGAKQDSLRIAGANAKVRGFTAKDTDSTGIKIRAEATNASVDGVKIGDPAAFTATDIIDDDSTSTVYGSQIQAKGFNEEISVALEVADASSGGNVAALGASAVTQMFDGRRSDVGIDIRNIDTTRLTGANPVYLRGFPHAAKYAQHIPVRSQQISADDAMYLSIDAGNTFGKLIKPNGTNNYQDVIVSDLSSGTADIITSFQFTV